MRSQPSRRLRFGFSIAGQLMLATAFSFLLLLAGYVVQGDRTLKAALIENVTAGVRQTSQILNLTVSAYATNGDLDSANLFFGELLDGQAKHGLVYVVVGRADGSVLSNTLGLGSQVPTPDAPAAYTAAALSGIVHVRNPLLLPGHEVGFLQYGMATTDLVAAIAQQQQESLQLIGVVMLASVTLMLLLGWRVRRRLRELIDASEEVASGRYERQIDASGGDELAIVAQHFNKMVEAVQGKVQEITALNASLEGRVAERTAALSVALEQAQSATQAKAEFLANMSHEIRTPMNAVMGLTDLALRHETHPKQQDYLRKIYGAAGSLLDIINAILDFSKAEAGKLELDTRPFLLQDVLEQVKSIVNVKAQEKGINFSIHIAPETPQALVGDPQRLRQVLINLCDNGVKFTERGSLVVRVGLADAVQAHEIALRFSVQDSGIGMDELQLSKLFTPFTQADASTTRRFGGTGLGLAISKQLVELMGGRIQVISQPGQGSDFQFTLPFKVDRMAALVTSAKALAPTSPPLAADVSRLKGLRILLVEDNALNQAVAQELLTCIAGAEVTIANHGREAIDCLNIALPDLVLMDVQMPVMDGYEATKYIRSQPQWLDLPIIAMTAHALPQDRERCLAIGMNDHVTKPFHPDQLFSVLAKWARPRLTAGVSSE